MNKLWLILLSSLAVLAGCASMPQGFSMYPTPLQEGEVVPANMAILLVGITGTSTVNYLQFTHSAMPAINAKFSEKGNGIIAIAVPVGIKQLSLSTITLGDSHSGYLSSGMSYGYVPVRTKKMDIDQPGIYYIATLNTNAPGQFQELPISSQMQSFRNGFKSSIGKLEPINFQWTN